MMRPETPRFSFTDRLENPTTILARPLHIFAVLLDGKRIHVYTHVPERRV